MSDLKAQLLPTLKRYLGFSSFRPLQEAIIHDALDGRDVFALLPTGGGKSMCFQLPALVRPGLTVVVSPLIALMKDQVDALTAIGAPATFLNSSLESGEGRSRLRGLYAGDYRLLYVAPERLLLSGFLEEAQRWNVNQIAIDEAHCISEWGHDFRPEYRKIAQLRATFPDIPMMALTATATGRVRDDIIRLLGLREPRTYVASFNRPNLCYRVVPKKTPYDQILAYLRSHPEDSGIVYCMARKTTEMVADQLKADGIAARPYHAGLNPEDRSKNQELFLRDEVRVICATIAFGMGINKPNVRFVIHHDLPKNLESYYQETGRAGRDGLPSECLLLFSGGDASRQQIFINEKPDPSEQAAARAQLNQMMDYAETPGCRRASLLDYFGEEFPEANCGSCDNCLNPRSRYDATVSAQKMLSCVYRIHDKSGFAVGMNHLVDVLLGANTEKIRRWGHQTLSTYGIGRDTSKSGWTELGRELIRRGLLEPTKDKFPVLQLTPLGRSFLQQRKKLELARPIVTAQEESTSGTKRAGAIECDEVLFERLRARRKRLADEMGVPPYIVFADTCLRWMARQYPRTPDELLRVPGVGENKLRLYGSAVLEEISIHLAGHPIRHFEETIAPSGTMAKTSGINETTRDSLRRFRSGQPIDEIARERGFEVSTIEGHLAKAIESGEMIDLDLLLTPAEQQEMGALFAKYGWENISGIRDTTEGRYSYGRLRLFRAARGKHAR